MQTVRSDIRSSLWDLGNWGLITFVGVALHKADLEWLANRMIYFIFTGELRFNIIHYIQGTFLIIFINS